MNPCPKTLPQEILRAQSVIYIPLPMRKHDILTGLVASSYMAQAKLTARTFTTEVTPSSGSWSFRGEWLG